MVTPHSLFGNHALVRVTISPAFRMGRRIGAGRLVNDEATGEWLGRDCGDGYWKLYPRDGADYAWTVHKRRVTKHTQEEE